jgi:hypothetical protein
MDGSLVTFVAIDLGLFFAAFIFSMKFLKARLFADQELKQGYLN